jgi:hypothetical protein
MLVSSDEYKSSDASGGDQETISRIAVSLAWPRRRSLFAEIGCDGLLDT